MHSSARRFRPWLIAAAVLAAALRTIADEKSLPVVTVSAEPIHGGRVSPLLFGNFIELLDDVAPAMWAEMLNDRSFEGVEPAANRFYFDGSPDFCDRQWEQGRGCTVDTDRPFNGARCARLTAARDQPAALAQSGLAVKSGLTYHFSGYFRAAGSPLAASVTLKTLLPDGSWMTLASAPLPAISDSWEKRSASMVARGTTDRAIFELAAEGDGRLWVDKLSLMPDDHVRGWRRDVVDTVKALHPPIIRWGGSIIDPGQYRWKSGIGDRDARTPFRNKIWGRVDPNDVGIDEFCQFCEAVGAEPLLCVSLSDGPESAHDLVQYCNSDAGSSWADKRAANGHPLPYHVKYWQVGNEIAGDRPDYLSGIEDFIHAIKRADPTALVMSSYPASKLLELAGPDLAFVCPHEYTRDLARVESSLSRLSQEIDATPGCGHLKIAITEWNVSGGEWGIMRGRQMTLETALFNARHLHVMMRHCDKVEIANRSNLANSYCGATFETNPAGILLRPSHYVMALYTHHARPIPLQVESPLTALPPQSGASNLPVAGLDLFACASPDKKSVTLFAINPDTKPIEFRLASQGFDRPLRLTGAEAVCDTQNALQVDVMNHWTAPYRVKTVKLKTTGDTVLLPPLSTAAIESE